MPETILFEEVQNSGSRKLRDFCRGLAVVFALACVVNLFLQRGRISGLTLALLTGVALPLLVGLIGFSRLITQIRSDGIYVRYPPFQPGFSRFAWEEILDVYIRPFNALAEYNGWGIKYGLMGLGYILPSNTGLQIVLRNKKRILISTRRPEELNAVLRNLGWNGNH